jgi:succinate-semialdehyde dehydrogenase/glutarate-semialdehyde dehydrogenase
MKYVSINPVTGQVMESYPAWDRNQLQAALERARDIQVEWRRSEFEARAVLLTRTADRLRERRDQYAGLITRETGKVLRESLAEIDKCALVCDYYAVHGQFFLDDEIITTDAGKSYVAYQPLGTVLGVMALDFPFWHLFRFAAPVLMAGNAILLKPAPRAPQCALAIEALLREAGFPVGVFSAVLIDNEAVAEAVAGPWVDGVSVTGSEATGRRIAAVAGQNLKKCVLQLGGADPFIVLRDANLNECVKHAVASRFLNCGQSAIAAKRLILVPEIADEFLERFKAEVATLKVGDPLDPDTDLGSMSSLEAREELHRQVTDSLAAGAIAEFGCQLPAGTGAFYPPSILDDVTPRTRAYHEELYGPVAVVIRAKNDADAIRIANDSRFALGASIWSENFDHAETIARELVAGTCFVNGIVKSDPRLPYGGAKASGLGRELSYHGIREFTNVKTVWVRDRDPNVDRRSVNDRRRANRRGDMNDQQGQSAGD